MSGNDETPPEAVDVAAQLTDNIVKLYGVLGATSKTCSCGREIWWVLTKNGRPAPYTNEAVSHFADCPHADRYRKGKK
ncbi:MAG: hypothetical protein V3V75_04635 [Thermoguttaceae bacterium]